MKRSIFIACLLGLMLLSCNKHAFETPVDSDIEVTLRTEGPSYFLRAETILDYPCVNYPINYSFSRIGTDIRIRFKYIENIEVCLTAIGPATCEIDLGELSNSREYNVQFKHNGLTTQAFLLEDSLWLEDPGTGNILITN